MTEETEPQTVDAPADPVIAQDEPAEVPATEVAPDPAAAPAASETPPAVENQPNPGEASSDPGEVVENEVETPVRNPNALRGVAAGPADHPRVIAAREAAAER